MEVKWEKMPFPVVFNLKISFCMAFVLTQRESILVDQPHFLRTVPCLLCSYLLLCFHLWRRDTSVKLIIYGFTQAFWTGTSLIRFKSTPCICPHLSEKDLSFNDTKIVFLPWSETSADRITIRVQRGPRSVRKKTVSQCLQWKMSLKCCGLSCKMGRV